ncbi:MAG: hypothetical protein IJH84_05085 [Saccharopolyspora sp.]|uniref:hypothetical protein n=1 Tax=unclassified Saccharopolyspora TaxID=2646250 RepID=UPI0025F529B5|nr:hypothetical protein [Saccharopolyspora sp.]MBQ6640397.1 hypothetical protein [Saccharopolyspora sp.]
MTGFRIDPEALEGAIKELEDARDRARAAAHKAMSVKPGELTAKDSTTETARQKFIERASGDSASLRASADAVKDRLTEKIEAYRATLEEYRRAEDNATVDSDRINRQA